MIILTLIKLSAHHAIQDILLMPIKVLVLLLAI